MYIKTPADLGIIIRERRRQIGLDQGSLAARVGVSRQWIVEVEKGKPRAEVGLVLRTLNALGAGLRIENVAVTGPLSATLEPATVRDRPPYASVDIDEIIEHARKKGP